MRDRTVMRLLKKTYPTIYDDLTQKAALTDLCQIETLLDKFCAAKNIQRSDVYKNRDQSRMLFITIITKAYDPMFFIDEDKQLMKELRRTLAAALFCHDTQISHILSTVKTYLKVYRWFREDTAKFYAIIINNTTNESCN